jgi:XTP/dITP diphosphohydrolase
VSDAAVPHVGAPAQRLLLVDTVDQLPGLLPWHAVQALRTCDLIVLGRADHPLAAALELADERVEVVPAGVGEAALGRADLLAGLSLADKARAAWVVDRVRAAGSVGYVFGPADTDAFTRTLGMEAAREGIEVEVVYFGLAPKGVRLLDLVAVQERLLAPGGCPWDAEQTHATLAKYAIEEAHELAEAIASDDPAAIAEELGDVLMQVTFHAEIADGFDIDAVAAGIADKLVRRHPHVFADGRADTAGEVEASWEQIKAAEKPDRQGPFDGIPTGLPAIALAAKVRSRAERAGLVPPLDADAVGDRLAEGLGGVLAADPAADVGAADGAPVDEVGDVLLAAVDLARAAGVDPEDALRRAVARFRARAEEDGAAPAAP